MGWSQFLVLVGLLLAGIPTGSAEPLRLAVDTRKSGRGAFNISYAGRLWLSGGEYRVGSLSSSQGSLVLVDANSSRGEDGLGSYEDIILSWAASRLPEKVLMHTSFHKYGMNADSDVIVFEQIFPSEVDLASLSTNSPLAARTIFPGFLLGGGAPDLPCFSYHGVFPQLKACSLANYTETKEGGTPLVIYNASERSLPMVVFSPLDNAMAHHMAHGSGFFGAGVKATVEKIPGGWRQRFLLSAGKGINSGMMAWGDSMLKFLGKPRVDNRYRDDVHGGIGFWTDNGGFYHYSVGKNASLGGTYEEVLPKVKAYHEELGVPFRHWQFDSWFYPKDARVRPGGGGGAVTNWTAMPSVFPRGMAHMQSKLRVPMVMHNRQWSPRSDYIRNWPDLEWYVSDEAAVPRDPAKFFERFFQQQEGWGLSMYEQDWLNLEYDKVKDLRTNASLGDLWLRGMAAGAAGSNRTVQFCMPYPSQVLAAAGLPAVTNARATGDYFHQDHQWAIGGTAIFYWALGILPFKDGFYSSNLKQVGGETEGPETDPDREALMATLSCAMVGPMDGIYLLNKSRVMAACRQDGVVLKPDRPLTTTDACFRTGRPACWVYETFSDVDGLGRVHYYYNDDGAAPMLAEEVYVEPSEGYAVYNWYTGDLAPLEEVNHLASGYEGHIYALAVPLKQEWALLGEVAVFVPLSTRRFSAVSATAGNLTVDLHGVPGERLRVCAARSPSLRVLCKAVAVGREARATLVFRASEWQEEGPVVLV